MTDAAHSFPRIAYAGMTHLGLNSAVAAAEKGFQVLCFDPDADLIGRLERGELPVLEPDLPDLLERNRSRLRFSAEGAALADCELVYVAPDVPTEDDGTSDLTGLDALLELTIGHVRPAAVVVVLSQVPPGYTRARQRAGLQLYYQVETLIFGRAIERALYPERYIVGCPDPEAPLPESLATYLGAFGCPILPMRLESAELCKISINCCLVASISVANTLAELCERIGADWSEIAPALRLDKRIGPYSYLKPGLGIGGGNLIRDLNTVIRMADGAGSDSRVVQAWVGNSEHARDWAWRALCAAVPAERQADTRLAILGLAYKENTRSTRNSPAFALIRHLGHMLRPVAFDPAVPAAEAPHPAIDQGESAEAACRGADVVAIMTPWPEFKTLDPVRLAGLMRGRLVLDPYAVLDRKAAEAAGLDYLTLGLGQPGAEVQGSC